MESWQLMEHWQVLWGAATHKDKESKRAEEGEASLATGASTEFRDRQGWFTGMQAVERTTLLANTYVNSGQYTLMLGEHAR